MTEPVPTEPKRARRRAAGPPAPTAGQPDRVPSPATPDRTAVSSLRLERGGIGHATADRVDLRLGGISRLEADDVFVQYGGVALGRAATLSVEWGVVGAAAAAGELRVQQGLARAVIAREAIVDQGIVRTLIAQRVTVTRPSAALLVLAARVDGEVRALLDWRGALALGLGLGLAGALGRLLRRAR